MLPKKGEENNNKVDICLADYISSRFILKEDGNVEVDTNFPKNVVTCDTLDSLMATIYNKSSAS